MCNQESYLQQFHPQRVEGDSMWVHPKPFLFQAMLGLSILLGGASHAFANTVTVTFDTPTTFNSAPTTLPNFNPDPNYDALVFDPASFNPVIFEPNFLTTEEFAFSPKAGGELPHNVLIDNPSDVPCTVNVTPQNFGGCVDNGSNYLLEEAGPGGPEFALGAPIIMTHSSGRPFSLLEFDASKVFLDGEAAAIGGFPNADQINLEGALYDGTTLQLSFPLQDPASGFSTYLLPQTWVNLKSVTFSGSVLNQNGEPSGTGAIGIDNLSALTDSLITDRDSFISGKWHKRNRNKGGKSSLVVRKKGQKRTVIGFDIDGISKAGLEKVTLVLTIKGHARYWGHSGGMVNVHSLSQSFTEGNGKYRSRGNGAGVTWNCATDTNISNRRANCDQYWGGGSNEASYSPTDAIKHHHGMTGEVRFDVTPDVLDMLDQEKNTVQWLVRKAKEYRYGRVKYYSKEGADKAGDLMKAPRLELEYSN